MENKTHYRKVFKSDHLGVADLEDLIEEKKKLVFTILYVKQEIGVSVAGRKGNHNIAYFKESIKPMVLNATNSKIIKSFAPKQSPFVEDWNNITVELYIDPNVKMKGETTGGVRIRTVKPSTELPILTKEMKAFNAAKDFLINGGNISAIELKYKLTPEIKKALNETS